MIRVVRAVDGTVSVDSTGKRSGRGAYVCRQLGCWEQALKRRTLDRALKVELDAETRQRLEAFAKDQPGAAAVAGLRDEVVDESKTL
jgi:predicted RNA-binding protein YlxR (DUF448 family)